MIDREKYAYEEGKRAAMRCEGLSQYQPSYKRLPALWRKFVQGYSHGLKEKTDVVKK